MTRTRTSYHYKNVFRQSWHPSIDELLLYLDGEIQAKTNPKVEAHLRVCWSCRVKREKIERFISAFMEQRKTLLAGSLNFPPEALPRFAAQLSDLELDSGDSRLFSHFFGWLRSGVFHLRFSLRYASFLLACSLILFFFIRLSSVPPVSAKEVLQRAERAEAQRIRQLPSAVVYQKLQLRRSSSVPGRPEFLTWEIWNDATNNRSRQRVEDASGPRLLPLEASDAAPLPDADSLSRKRVSGVSNTGEDPSSLPPILAELGQVFQANHMDPRRPLSPASYEAWRRSIRNEAGEVIQTTLPDGGEALTLKTVAPGPFARNAIIEANLVIRAADWHPVEQRLKVQGQEGLREYALSEAAFEVVALNSLSPSIFADLNLSQAPLAIAQTPIAPPVTPTAVELTAAEIEAHYALHRLNVCLGEPIEIVRGPSGQIVVQGLAETAERKTELLAALGGIPLVAAKIQTVEEANRAVSSAPQVQDEARQNIDVPLSEASGIVEIHSRKLPIQDQLERYFLQVPNAGGPREGQNEKEPIGIRRKIDELSTEAVSLSEAAMSEVWALRRLADRYASAKADAFLPSARWLLEVMVKDHMKSLDAQIKRSNNLLEPALVSFAGRNDLASSSQKTGWTEMSHGANPDWAGETLQVFGAVERVKQLTHRLFAHTNLPAGNVEGAATDLLTSIHNLKIRFENLESLVARRFSNQSDLLASEHSK
ncbi:MAG: hypothetical protein L0387_26000 [Acidobacteria bacterium]|nr:hypothetical protein [Acidobacteriota bacterium]MCI0724965.1 hypothetical protein [Acidobacteriota bacterium]